LKYIDQAKWYLNGFWADGGEAEAENIWKYTAKFIELDTKSKKAGCELDEFMAHKFLESLGETLTVLALRDKLRKIDLDANGRMALLEYLCFRYSKPVSAAVNNPQGGGDNKDQVDAAAAKLDQLMTSLAQLQEDLAKQEEALSEQRKAEDEVKRAEAENKAAVDDLHHKEEEYKKQIETLEKKSTDASSGIVSRNKAAQELAQLKNTDPLPLRKAKLTAEASLRKVERERKAAEAATKVVEEAKSKISAQVSKTEAETQEAQNVLEELKKQGGTAKGSIWWMEREVKEAKKYLPKSKQ
jgi:chromosome segregation ATPase